MPKISLMVMASRVVRATLAGPVPFRRPVPGSARVQHGQTAVPPSSGEGRIAGLVAVRRRRQGVACAAANGDSGNGKKNGNDAGDDDLKGENLFKKSIDEFLGSQEGIDDILSGKSASPTSRDNKDEETWMDWGVEGMADWDGKREGFETPKKPQRPRYPRLLGKKNNVWRDDWLRPMVDPESIRQRLLISEKEASRLQEQEAIANSYESQQAVRFAGILIGVPIATALAARIFIIEPVLAYTLADPEAFPLSYMQEVEGAHEVHQEEVRLNMDIALGRAPELDEDEMQAHLRHKALEVLEETREHNKTGLANLCQDSLMASLLVTIVLLDVEGRTTLIRALERLISGVSDLGKAFVIILTADTLMGYHSEEGWTALIRVLAEHWNMEPEQNNVYIFVAVVPVLLDALFKLWIFQGFVRQNPAASVTLKAMDRH